MYPATSSQSDVFAEVYFFLGLTLCGALGYIFMKLTTKLLPEQVQSKADTLCEEEACMTENEKPQVTASVKRRKASSQQSKAQSKLEEQSEHSSAAQPLDSEVAASPPLASTDVSSSQDASALQAVPATPAAATSEEASDRSAAPAEEVSERVARLMAKKAERKERKKQQQAFLKEKEGEAQVLITIPEDAVADIVEQEKLIVKAAHEGEKKEHEFSIDEELSTGDEGLMQVVETAEESLWEEEEEPEETAEFESSWYDESHLAAPTESLPAPQEGQALSVPQGSLVFCSYAVESPSGYNGAACDDAWMSPIEETMRTREQAEQVYRHLQDMHAEAEAAQTMQYQPVLCSNNQKLYTDGEKLYMLACIDAAQNVNEGDPTVMRPIVDAHDPMHAEFAKDARIGLDRLPTPDQSRGVCILPPQPVERLPCMAQDDSAWDVCW